MDDSNRAMQQESMWQVEVGGQIYVADFEGLKQWISEGALQPHDKVRRKNLRWREADKIPVLSVFFNAKELGLPIQPEVSISESETIHETENIINSVFLKLPSAQNFTAQIPQIDSVQPKNNTSLNSEKPQTFSSLSQNFAAIATRKCSLHEGEGAQFICSNCAKMFCKTCPKSYGGNIKICPDCGEMCKPIAEIQELQTKSVQKRQDLNSGFGFVDFGDALAYPFRFKFSLISGAILFMFFSLGQNAYGFGGMFMITAAIFCSMLANTLTFGILANTVENFSQGKINLNFMPAFDDFNLWDDVIHPFFLSIGAYLVSFGLLLAIIVGGLYFASKSVKTIPASGINQNRISEKSNDVNSSQNSEKTSSAANTIEQTPAISQNNAKKFEQLEKEIKQAQQNEIAEISSKTEISYSGFADYGKFFFLCVFVSMIWGVFYFPAACTVAGYTRSFMATINPAVGLDTIKRLGFEYIKILFFGFIIFVLAAIINYFLSVILSPFDLPQVGNLLVKAAGSFFSFYFSIVFSVTLGFALYKNSAKLSLFRS